MKKLRHLAYLPYINSFILVIVMVMLFVNNSVSSDLTLQENIESNVNENTPLSDNEVLLNEALRSYNESACDNINIISMSSYCKSQIRFNKITQEAVSNNNLSKCNVLEEETLYQRCVSNYLNYENYMRGNN